ncbi:MAG: hypothetical protein LC130_26960 [Bryobacterales bacterium]|nr:hypothetical protein [Bryobacterales bacterium]
MKFSFPATLLALCASAWAQPNPFYGVLYPQLQEFLQLTDSQLNAILEANRQYSEWAFEKQRRIADVQREIAEETAKSPLDPMALGVRYAEVETICREVKDRGTELEKASVTVLTDAQKTKLKTLEDALKLFPAITQAQSARLLGGPAVGLGGVQVMGVTTITDRFNRTDGLRLGTAGFMIPGCIAPTPWIDTNVFRQTGAVNQNPSAELKAPDRPMDATAHRWFNTTTFAGRSRTPIPSNRRNGSTVVASDSK